MSLTFNWQGENYSFEDYQRAKEEPGFRPKPPPKIGREQYQKMSVEQRQRYEALRRLHANYRLADRQQSALSRRMPPGYDVDVMRRTQVFNESGKALQEKDFKVLREGLGAMHRTTEDLAKKLEELVKSGKGQRNSKEYAFLHSLVKDNLELSRKLASGRSLSSRQLGLMLTGYKDIERLASGMDKYLINTIQMNEFFKRNQIDAAFSNHERNAYTQFLSEMSEKIDLDVRKLPGLDPSKLAQSTGGTSTVLGTALLGALGPIGQIAGLVLNSQGGHQWIEKQGAKAINKLRGTWHNMRQARGITAGGIVDGSDVTSVVDTKPRGRTESAEEIAAGNAEDDRVTPESLASTLNSLFEKFRDAYDGDREAMLDDFTEGMVEGIGEELRRLSKDELLILHGRDLTKDVFAELKKSGFDDEHAEQLGLAIATVVKEQLEVMGHNPQSATIEAQQETAADRKDREEWMHKEDTETQERLAGESNEYLGGKLDTVIDILSEINKRTKRGGGLLGGVVGGLGDTAGKVVAGGILAGALAKSKGLLNKAWGALKGSVGLGKGAAAAEKGIGGKLFKLLAATGKPGKIIAGVLGGGAIAAGAADAIADNSPVSGESQEIIDQRAKEKQDAQDYLLADGIATASSGLRLAKTVGQMGGKAGVKTIVKKVPLVGALASLGFGAMRAKDGDWIGAGLEIASGLTAIVPGLGTAASFGIDATLLARDIKRATEDTYPPDPDVDVAVIPMSAMRRSGTGVFSNVAVSSRSTAAINKTFDGVTSSSTSTAPSVEPQFTTKSNASSVSPFTKSSSGKGRYATFDSKAPQIMDRLMKDFDLSPEHAAIIVGNLGHESGGFTALQEKNPLIPGSRGGWGWAQWTGPRRKQFEKFAKDNGLDPSSDEANYAFLKHELSTNYKGSLDALKSSNASDPNAMIEFERTYEGAGIKHYDSRFSYANRSLEQWKNAQAEQAARIEAIDQKPSFANVQSSVSSVSAGRSEALPADSMYAGAAPIPAPETVTQAPAEISADSKKTSDGADRNSGLAYAPSLNDATFSLDDPGLIFVGSGTV